MQSLARQFITTQRKDKACIISIKQPLIKGVDRKEGTRSQENN
jgi:hypothetical protein